MDIMGLQKASPERTHHHPCPIPACNAKCEPHQEETSDTSDIPFHSLKLGGGGSLQKCLCHKRQRKVVEKFQINRDEIDTTITCHI